MGTIFKNRKMKKITEFIDRQKFRLKNIDKVMDTEDRLRTLLHDLVENAIHEKHPNYFSIRFGLDSTDVTGIFYCF